jgi:S1-C subfamily serine protease
MPNCGDQQLERYMTGQQRFNRPLLLLVILVLGVAAGAQAETSSIDVIRDKLWQTIGRDVLEQPIAPPPITRRGGSARGPAVYRDRVSGVVLIASRAGTGTGALVSRNGDIVTNQHVIEDAYKAEGQELVGVWFKPRQGLRPTKDDMLVARVVATSSQQDLALVRLVRPLPSEVSPIPLSSSMPEIGQDVFVIGHPKEYFWSFTQGIVSQIRPGYRWSYDDRSPRMGTTIQTQAPVNPGNSGGPLLNDDGAIVGIVVGSASEAMGIYFAVAVEHVRDLLLRRP